MLPIEVKNADVIFLSHSGGKDSQAALAQLVRMGLKDKIVIVHSNLGDMEWEHMTPWIKDNSFGCPVYEVQAEEDFFQMARRVGKMPSGMMQFCTDTLKTQPIKQFIHDYMYKHGFKTAINATGMRAEESKRRANKLPFTLSKGKGTSGMTMPKKHPEHTIWDYMPIFGYDVDEVFQEIDMAGQKPHRVYKMGFSRLSCVFCVNGRMEEHKKAARLRPNLARKMAKLERDLGKTIRMKQVKGIKYPKYLDEYIRL